MLFSAIPRCVDSGKLHPPNSRTQFGRIASALVLPTAYLAAPTWSKCGSRHDVGRCVAQQNGRIWPRALLLRSQSLLTWADSASESRPDPVSVRPSPGPHLSAPLVGFGPPSPTPLADLMRIWSWPDVTTLERVLSNVASWTFDVPSSGGAAHYDACLGRRARAQVSMTRATIIDSKGNLVGSNGAWPADPEGSGVIVAGGMPTHGPVGPPEGAALLRSRRGCPDSLRDGNVCVCGPFTRSLESGPPPEEETGASPRVFGL